MMTSGTNTPRIKIPVIADKINAVFIPNTHSKFVNLVQKDG